MKKLIPFCSPYLLLILPALLFVSLSFAINKEVKYTAMVKKNYTVSQPNANDMISFGKKSLIQLLLK